MKIFGISLVKNEADIISYNLVEAAKWADKIFVYDNGSEDDTWEIVNELAKTNSTIVPYKKEALPFRDELRAKVFNHYRHLASDGDWWCFRLDSDEFYIDDPKEFLRKVHKRYHVVCKESFDYRLTFEDVEEFSFKDRSPDDIFLLKYYNPKLYTEKRFFRHRNRLRWPEHLSSPDHMGIISPDFIRLKHFQYRSPNQVQSRLDKKKIATAEGYRFFKNHDAENDWREILEHRSNLILETEQWRHEGHKYPNLYKKSLIRELTDEVFHALKIYP